MTNLVVGDVEELDLLIAARKRLGHDRYDEVWEGVYVMPTQPNLEHQKLVAKLTSFFLEVVDQEGRGDVYPGANVSDRRKDWKKNFMVPDVLALRHGGIAVPSDTFIYRGPDFVVEIESPGDESEEKIPFYAKIGVREFLLVDRDKRTLRLLRHDGEALTPVAASTVRGETKQWLVSEVLPLAFRKVTAKGVARTEVLRTDGTPGRWTV